MHKEIYDFLKQIDTEDNAKIILVDYLENNKAELNPELEIIFLNTARLLVENKRLQGHEKELKNLIEKIRSGDQQIDKIDTDLANLDTIMNPPQM
jgi:anthranilate phosphoribosyltransferase